MKIRNKLVALLCAVTCVVCLAGCGGNADTADKGDKVTEDNSAGDSTGNITSGEKSEDLLADGKGGLEGTDKGYPRY